MDKIFVACIDVDSENGGEPFIKRGFINENEAHKYVEELEVVHPHIVYFVDTIYLDGMVTRSHPIEMENFNRKT
ncbi:hypothetical protein M0R36_10990 [bacterium]|jgi:hypothetical protein|nr:hypothetical protein [bacterium]